MAPTTNDDSGTTVGTGSLIQCGLGADLAQSSGSITVTDGVHYLTGTGTINTISFGTGGTPANPVLITFIRATGSTVQFGSGGNIIGAIPTLADEQNILAVWDGSLYWHFPGTTTPFGLNVRDFGAAGDYDADDYAAIQAAITAASASGGTVYFPIGHYKILTGLTVSGLVRLVGESGYRGDGTSGGASWITAAADITAITFSSSAASGSELCDLTITPDAAVVSTKPGVLFTNTSNSQITRCFIGGINPSGGAAGFLVGVRYSPGVISPQSCYLNAITHSTISGNTSINIDGQSQTNQLTMQDVTFGGMSPTGLKLVDSGGLTLVGGDCEGVSLVGIDLDCTSSSYSDVAHYIGNVLFEGNTSSGGDIRIGNTTGLNAVTIAACLWSAGAGAHSAVHLVRGDNVNIIGGNLHAGYTVGPIVVETTFTGKYNVIGFNNAAVSFANEMPTNWHTQDYLTLQWQAATTYDSAAKDIASYNLLRLRSGSLTANKDYYAGLDVARLDDTGAVPAGVTVYGRKVVASNNIGGTTNSRALGLTGAFDQTETTLTYSASIDTNAATGNAFVITITNGTAHTINAPSNPVQGQFITYTLRNSAGGAAGVATWNAVFKMAAWVQAANANSRSITFKYNGTNWIEVSRTAADVPN